MYALEAFFRYNELHFLRLTHHCWALTPGLMYVAYGLVILVHKNIKVTTLTIGYIQFHQGFEC